MSKDNRTIQRAPRIHGRLVKDEDEIAAALTPEQGQKLIESKALSGDWTFTGTEPEPAEALATTANASDAGGEVEALRRQVAELTEQLDFSVSELQRRTSEFDSSLSKTQAALVQAERERDEAKAENAELRREITSLKTKANKAESELKAKTAG